jgi:hypothetical protein
MVGTINSRTVAVVASGKCPANAPRAVGTRMIVATIGDDFVGNTAPKVGA